MKLKNKLVLGLTFLFIVILIFGSLGIYYINRLSIDADKILTNNHESLVYCNNMLKALEDIPQKKEAFDIFEKNLQKQEANITEIGEKETTEALRQNFTELLANPADASNYRQLRQSLQRINELNEDAIYHKNTIAKQTAETAKLWLTIVFTILSLLVITFMYNFPEVISNPIVKLSEGISAIANKEYHKRIHLEQKDEFGDLANAFNTMAEKLDEYENSNLAKIKFEKSRIETIINQMKDGIIGFDENRNILFLNAVAERLLGIEEKEILGKYAADVALKNDLMRTLLQETATTNELKIYADKKESYFNKDVLNVTNNGQVIGQVIVLRNITPFHELNEAKTNFIATVSHELKTPISSIKMSAKLLTDSRVGVLNDEQDELIKSISDDAERLLKITGELLNLAQVETGNIHLKMQLAQPAEIVTKALQAVQFQAQQKQIEINTHITSNLPAIQVDADKISWVLINLLTNAIKYSHTNSTVEVAVKEQNDYLVFSVKDAGIGIEKKYLPKIFDKYFKVPGNNETSGTGLGLAICKEFIEAQNGTIWVKSTAGTGSKFGFELKIA